MAQGAAIGLGALFMQCNEACSKQVGVRGGCEVGG